MQIGFLTSIIIQNYTHSTSNGLSARGLKRKQKRESYEAPYETQQIIYSCNAHIQNLRTPQ